MKASRINTLILFLALTVINIGIFVFRDWFQYQPYENYSSLYAECGENCRSEWSRLSKDFTEIQLKEANDTLRKNTSIDSATNTIEKIAILGAFIYNKFYAQFGQPSQKTMQLPPLEKYKFLLRSSEDSLWCADFTSLILLFASSQNILCRSIEIHGLHAVNECYVPELKQWILVDVTYNTLAAISGKNEYLNLQSFKKSIAEDAPVYRLASFEGQNKIVPIDKKSFFITTYYKPGVDSYYYYTTDLSEVYQVKEKIKRYFLPVSWYKLYNSEQKTNVPFYTKLIFSFAWLVLLLLMGYKNLKDHSRNN